MSIFEPDDMEQLGAALDVLCADMDEQDTALLHSLFAYAGAGRRSDDDEVVGFSMFSPPAGGFFQSYQFGASQPSPLPGKPAELERDALNPQPLPP